MHPDFPSDDFRLVIITGNHTESVAKRKLEPSKAWSFCLHSAFNQLLAHPKLRCVSLLGSRSIVATGVLIGASFQTDGGVPSLQCRFSLQHVHCIGFAALSCVCLIDRDATRSLTASACPVAAPYWLGSKLGRESDEVELVETGPCEWEWFQAGLRKNVVSSYLKVFLKSCAHAKDQVGCLIRQPHREQHPVSSPAVDCAGELKGCLRRRPPGDRRNRGGKD